MDYHVNEPTHTKGNILDLILSRETINFGVSDVKIGELISDHFSVSCRISISRSKHEKRHISYRNINSINVGKFKEDIENLPVYKNYENLDLPELVEAYDRDLHALLDQHAPLITKVTSSKRREPWIDNTILDSQRMKRQIERKFRKGKCDLQRLNTERDRHTQLINKTKNEFYSNVVEENRCNSQKLFKTLNTIMNRDKKNPLPEHHSSEELANQFNLFFKEKVDKIRADFPQDCDNAHAFDKFYTDEPLTNFQPLTIEDILKILNSAKPKSCQMDPIPTSLLKQCAHELAPIILRIVNLSLCSASFPSKYKHAKALFRACTKELSPCFEPYFY